MLLAFSLPRFITHDVSVIGVHFYLFDLILRKIIFFSDVIDLTGDDKDDLQRAIALSLAESNRAFRETGITDEEQAISR